MTVQNVIIEKERCYIKGMLDNSSIIIDVFEPPAIDEVSDFYNIVNRRKIIEARISEGRKCDDKSDAAYSFEFFADSLTDAIS